MTMPIEEFLLRIARESAAELVYRDPTVCILRYRGPEGERMIRLGLWAVRRMQWERLVEALGIPVGVAS
jgi:hypothetical protein